MILKRKSNTGKIKIKPEGLYESNFIYTEKDLHTEKLKPSESVINLTSSLSKKSSWTEERRVEKFSLHDEIYKKYNITGIDDGRIGSFLVEVLGCVGLPKIDRFTKPNTQVYLICGDCAFCTDTLFSSRSPIWPCKARRAALFPIFHAYARLYVGVFDLEDKKTKTVNDRFTGRVVLDVAMLRPHTIYDVTLPLRESANVYNTRPRGVIRLRFHLHWYNETSAITSYFANPFKKKVMSIPCADAKTFRNTAVTVYGENLPGQFSSRNFRATTRESNLYEKQLKHMFLSLLLSFMFWDNKYISLYIFSTWLLCAYFGSISLAPSIFIGLLVLLMINNYLNLVVKSKASYGYTSISFTEIFFSLLVGAKNATDTPVMEPISVNKVIIPENRESFSGNIVIDENIIKASKADHCEFPFSERNTHFKRPLVDNLYTSKSKEGNVKELTDEEMYRLSIKSREPKQQHGYSCEAKKKRFLSMGLDVSALQKGREVIAKGHLSFHSDDEDDDDDDDDDNDWSDSESDDDNEDREEGRELSIYNRTVQVTNTGPEQNADKLVKSKPFKFILRKMEKRVHNLTLELGLEEVADCAPSNQDKFDKLLGLHHTPSNIITRVKADYQGPVMRIANVGNIIIRIIVNIFIWKDPIFSFWVVVFLSYLALMFAVVPWRRILSIVGFFLFGPQNLLLKNIILAKIAAKIDQNNDKKYQQKDEVLSESFTAIEHERIFHRSAILKDNNKGEFAKPRSIYVPYTPFRKERFYDWPPNPEASRAVPFNIIEESKIDHLSVLNESIAEYDNEDEDYDNSSYQSVKQKSM